MLKVQIVNLEDAGPGLGLTSHDRAIRVESVI
jgi:hypothetical protein